jgi:hypothetical protein
LECLPPEPDTLPVELQPQQLGPELRPLQPRPLQPRPLEAPPPELDKLPPQLSLCRN